MRCPRSNLAKLYKVEKMTFARPTPEQKAAGQKHDKTRIIYNSHITLPASRLMRTSTS